MGRRHLHDSWIRGLLPGHDARTHHCSFHHDLRRPRPCNAHHDHWGQLSAGVRAKCVCVGWVVLDFPCFAGDVRRPDLCPSLTLNSCNNNKNTGHREAERLKKLRAMRSPSKRNVADAGATGSSTRAKPAFSLRDVATSLTSSGSKNKGGEGEGDAALSASARRASTSAAMKFLRRARSASGASDASARVSLRCETSYSFLAALLSSLPYSIY